MNFSVQTDFDAQVIRVKTLAGDTWVFTAGTGEIVMVEKPAWPDGAPADAEMQTRGAYETAKRHAEGYGWVSP